ncbi:MAG: GGDEF domain-containing protein [Thiohalomonadales bacterium]
MHSEINSVKSYSKYYLGVIGLLVVILMITSGYFRIKDFHKYQKNIAERAVTVTSNGITQLLIERVRQVKLLISDQVDYIRLYSGNPKSLFIRDKLTDQIENYFPNYVGFVIESQKNKLVVEGLNENIGKTCIDKANETLTKKLDIVMHAGPKDFHYDIVSKWGNKKSGGLFIMSFKVDDIVNLLKFAQPLMHELIISSEYQNEVYMTAEGSQDILQRNINKLIPDEIERIMVSLPIIKTNWLLLDIRTDSLLGDHNKKVVIQTILVIALFCVLLFTALRIIFIEEKKRSVIEKKLRDSKDNLMMANIELKKVAVTDAVTGISSRRSFDERIQQEISRARRNEEPLAVIMADIDHFKLYNDTFGHTKGDEALYQVAQAIKSVLKRPTDFVARYGGEEFVILLVNTQENGAKIIAEDIRNTVLNLKIPHSSGTEEFVTLSLGISVDDSYSEVTPKLLVEQADKALYHAKDKGRNQVSVFEGQQSQMSIL